MDFIRISLADVDEEAAEAIGDVFNQYGYGGAVIEMAPPDFSRITVSTVIPAEDDGVLQKIEIALALMGKVLPSGLPTPKLDFIGKNDWAESWKEHFHVVHVGERVVVQPSWRDYQPKPDDVVIKLDPGVAFGTGLHPTTQLCLRILQQMTLAGLDLFDVGTGSGILAIAAAKMGAWPVRAVDVDDVAVRVAQENFAQNNLPDIESAIGSATEGGDRQWQLTVANILANILVEIMADLKAAMTPTGRLILSGIINEQEESVLKALPGHGLEIESRHTDGDWIALVVRKSA